MKSSFSELNDREWLENRYLTDKKSSVEIGNEIGCTGDNVRKFLKYWNIPLRDNRECQSGRLRGSIYEELNNYEWLYDLYIVKQRSLVEISDLLKCANHNSIRQALQRFNIPIRDRHDAQCLNQEPIILNRQIIDGGMLGDASFKKASNKGRDSYPHYKRKNKYYEHVAWVAKEFYPENYDKYIFSEVPTNYQDRVYSVFCTSSYKELQPYYQRWYPESNNFKKLVPRDLVIDITLLRHWFFDDGFTTVRNRLSKGIKSKNQVFGALCSQGFYKEDNEYLCDIVNAKYNLGFRLKYQGTGHGYIIGIPQSKITDFLDLIGPPIPCFQYKWKKGKWAEKVT